MLKLSAVDCCGSCKPYFRCGRDHALCSVPARGSVGKGDLWVRGCMGEGDLRVRRSVGKGDLRVRRYMGEGTYG